MPAPKGNTNAAKSGEKADQRIEARVTPTDFALIDEARVIADVSRSKFVTDAAVAAAKRVIRKQEKGS